MLKGLVRGTGLGAEVRAAVPGAKAEDVGVVLGRRGADGRPEGFVHRGAEPIYPCSLVKAFHLVHALSALDEDWTAPHGELARARPAMVMSSPTTAPCHPFDILNDTTSTTLCEGATTPQ